MEIITFESEGQTLQGALYEKAHPNGSSKLEAGQHPVSQTAVIICHGAFEERDHWSAYAQRLAEQGFATLALDFVGHGSSTGQRGLVDLRQWAYNLRDAMNALAKRGYRRFALVGWASGGSAVLLAAAHDRRLVCAAVLAAPVQMVPPLSERVVFVLAGAVSRVWKAIKKKALTLSRVESYGKLRFAVDDEADAAYKANAHLQEQLKAAPIPGSLDSVWVDITKAVVKVKIPVLIIHGRQDGVVALKQSETVFGLLPGIKKMIVVEEAGHALHLDQKKEEVYIAIAKWLKHYLA